jgi:hypothetical protein
MLRTGSVGVVACVLTGWAALADAAITATPNAVSVAPGQTSAAITVVLTYPMVPVTTAPTRTGIVAIRGLPAGATTIPSPLNYTYLAGSTSASFPFQIVAGAATPLGTYTVTLEDVTFKTGLAAIILTVAPAVPVTGPPTITAVSPLAIVAGAPPQTIHVIGRNFVVGGRVSVDARGIEVLDTRVISPTLAEVTLATRDDAAPGPREIRVINPDKQETRPPGRIVISPASPLAGTITVTRAAIVFPQPGAFVGAADRLEARGLLSVSGTGTIIGSWLLDGVPFDRFALYATGGVPLHVTSHVPIPALIAGEHRLELSVDEPQQLLSSPLTLIGVSESRSALLLIEPADGATVSQAAAPTFRWTLVPGATGYEIEVEVITASGEPGESKRFRTAEAAWTPDAAIWATFGAGEWRWLVRPVFLDETRGEPSATRHFSLSAGPPSASVPAPSGSRRPRPSLRDSGGGRRFSLALGVPDGAPAAGPVATAVPATDGQGAGRVEWGATVQGTLTRWDLPSEGGASSGGLAFLPPGDVARVQAGLQLDLSRGIFGAQATGDVGARHDLEDPKRTVQENRNWLVTGRAQESNVTTTVKVGLGSPAFADQAELASTGLPRIGIEGAFSSSYLSASAYHTLDIDTATAGGALSLDQKIAGASLSLGRDGGSAFVRANLMSVETQAGPLTSGSKGSLVGAFGKLQVGGNLTLIAEAAHAKTEPQADSAPLPFEAEPTPEGEPPEWSGTTALEDSSGNAARVSLMGSSGLFSYAANLRLSDGGFSNPANPGFTQAGAGNLRSADLMLTQGFAKGAASLALAARHMDSAVAPAEDAPRLNNDGADATLTLGAGRRLMLMLMASAAFRRADAYETLGLPETDARDLGGSATFNQTLGGVTLSEMGSYQRSDDNINPYGDMETLAATLSLNGMIGPNVTLSLMGTGTRSQGDPALGKTDSLMASAQPIFRLPWFALSLQPALMYSRMRNTVLGTDTTAEQYGGLATWNPRWLRSFITFQFQADWSRQRALGIPALPFERRLAGALTLRWSGGQGANLTPPPAVSTAARLPSPAVGLAATSVDPRLFSALAAVRGLPLAPTPPAR